MKAVARGGGGPRRSSRAQPVHEVCFGGASEAAVDQPDRDAVDVAVVYGPIVPARFRRLKRPPERAAYQDAAAVRWATTSYECTERALSYALWHARSAS